MRSTCTMLTRALLAVTALFVAIAGNANELAAGKDTVLITGANRGIGLGFAQHYAAAGWNVIATARSPRGAEELQTLAVQYPNVIVEALDVTDDNAINALSTRYQGKPIDLLINNAGVLGDLEAQRFGDYDADVFQQVMAVNVFGPMKMSEAFADQVAASKHRKIVTITSSAAIITGASRPNALQFYSISKAAVNKAMRGIQGELASKGVLVILLSPGGVMTDMVREAFGDRVSQMNTQTVDQSVSAMAEVIAGVDSSYDGSHLDYKGNKIPW